MGHFLHVLICYRRKFIYTRSVATFVPSRCFHEPVTSVSVDGAASVVDHKLHARRGNTRRPRIHTRFQAQIHHLEQLFRLILGIGSTAIGSADTSGLLGVNLTGEIAV